MRLRSLDSVRGLAALAVVVYHFQHLAAFGQDPSYWKVGESALPYFVELKPIYIHGWMAVDLFFIISGFVFFWIYRSNICERKIDGTSFFILRLTRLYPLHIATLAVVAILQWFYLRQTGRFFIIPFNDVYHMWLNAMFLQGWGLERGPSFNGPSWSISVEMLLYLIFFFFSLHRLSKRASAVASMVCIGLTLQIVSPVIGRGLAGFFAGGLTYIALNAASQRPDARTIARISVAVAAALWIIVVACSYFDALDRMLDVIGLGSQASLANKAASRVVLYVLFPTTVFALAASERILDHDWERTSFLGDISYASYLVHFPLQIFFVLLVAHGVVPLDVVTGPAGLLTFFLMLLPLSWATYRYFELPMQKVGRRALLGRQRSIASS